MHQSRIIMAFKFTDIRVKSFFPENDSEVGSKAAEFVNKLVNFFDSKAQLDNKILDMR
jgi:hypothetical protein